MKAQVCVVDSKNNGFQCVNEVRKEGYFIPFSEGPTLLCASPPDTESLLKACQQKKVLGVTLCSYVPQRDVFECTSALGNLKDLSTQEAENYFCLSAQDRKRLLERCQ